MTYTQAIDEILATVALPETQEWVTLADLRKTAEVLDAIQSRRISELGSQSTDH